MCIHRKKKSWIRAFDLFTKAYLNAIGAGAGTGVGAAYFTINFKKSKIESFFLKSRGKAHGLLNEIILGNQ